MNYIIIIGAKAISVIEKIMNEIFSSKSMIWEAEKEWRLMWRNDETKLKFLRLNLLDESVVAIYLGCNIDSKAKSDFIFEITRNFPKAKIFKAKKEKGKFGLDFEQIAGFPNAALTENGNGHVKNP